MVRKARVTLWNRTVGAVLWDERSQRAEFQFDQDFVRSGLDVAPIMMPLAESDDGERIFAFDDSRQETFHGLPGMLADSLPDRYGEQLMNAWLQAQGRSPGTANPVERLCYMGRRGMGALEYEPAHNDLEASGEALQVDELVRMAGHVLSERKAFKTVHRNGRSEALMEIIRVGTSAGGARAKAVVAYNPSTGEVRSGQIGELKGFSYAILKFDGVNNAALGDPKGYGRIEYAYHLMAREARIEMMPCDLLEENGRAHFLTQRFDRVFDADGNLHKLHMATLCGIAHMDYNDPLAYSYEDAFGVMRLLGLPYPAAEQLFRRMCFNVIGANNDDHTKNISFLMDPQGDWHLSPAYDMSFAYNPDNMWLHQHQMSVNGKRSAIGRDDLLAVAKKMNIKKPDGIIDEVIAGVKSWRKNAKKAGVPAEQVKAVAEVLAETFQN